MKPSLDRTTVAGLVLVLGLGLAWVIFSWRGAAQASEAAADAHESQQVLTLLAALGAATTEAEASQRGYSLTGDPALLDGYEQARIGTESRLSALRTVLAGNAEQFSRLVALGPLLARHSEALTAAVEQRRRNAPAGAQMAATTDAKRLHDRVRSAIAEMQNPAEAAAAAAQARSRSQASLVQWSVAGGALLILLLATLLLLRLQQQRHWLRRAEAERDADHQAEQEASAVMDRLLDLVPDALGLIDTELRFVRVNGGAKALWGWSDAELGGRACSELIAPEEQRRTEQAFTAWMSFPADAPNQSLRTRCKRKDGKVIQVVWHAAWLAAEKQLLFVACDVTEIEALRHQEAELVAASGKAVADAAQAVARAATAHHLRADAVSTVGATLLASANSVLLNAQVLADGLAGTLTTEQQRRARGARDTALMLQRYGEELKALGQAESGALALAREAFDVWEAINKVAATLRVQAEMKGLGLDLKLADDLGYARGDAVRFERVLHNLIDWCIRQNGGGRIGVQAALASPGRLHVTVVDSGQATAPEQRALVLDFFKHDAAEPQPLGTVGDLSLAVARRLAHAMGGTLDASGQPEGIITLVLTLPSDTMGA